MLFVHAPTAIVPSADIARAVPLASQSPPRVLGCWLATGGGGAAPLPRGRHRRLQDARRRLRAFAMLVTYRRNRAQLIEAAPAPGTGAQPISRPCARSCSRCWAAGATCSTGRGQGGARCLRHPGGATTRVVADPATAAEGARGDRLPGGDRILSPDISHKSDVGGVVLSLAGAAQCARPRRHARRVRAARRRCCIRRLHRAGDGGSQVRRAGLIVGASIDRCLRPGDPVRPGRHGGGGAGRSPVALPPLNEPLARAGGARAW